MSDAVCLYDLNANGLELNDPLAELYQDLVHRLFEVPGSNLDDADRGVGIEAILSQAVNAAGGDGSQTITHRIETDFVKDNRVKQVRATVLSPAPNEYDVDIQVVADEGVLGIRLEADASGVRVVSEAP